MLVPVDVRVLDRKGQPITDLTAADFTILEDDVRQDVAYVSIHPYSDGHDPAVVPRGVDGQAQSGPTRPTHRTFLIVLGRGRLKGPANGIGAAINFVRERLLPQDRIAIAAYDRITDFTVDRRAILSLLERYQERHEKIEAQLDHWFTGLTAFYGDGENPPVLQQDIDSFFSELGFPPLRQLEALVPSGGDGPGNVRESVRVSLEDGGRDFVYNVAAQKDFQKLRAAISVLRDVDGEKHLIFLSEDGLTGYTPTRTDRAGHGPSAAEQLAALAADARVTVSPINTSGVQTSWTKSPDVNDLVIFSGPSWQTIWANADTRTIAQETGGIAAIYSYASEAFSLIERSTRSSYLLGYYPTNTTRDGALRRIRVIVARPDVRVLYRHAYYAHSDGRPYDRREALTRTRIDGASGYRAVVNDIGLKLSATLGTEKRSESEVSVSISVDVSKLTFAEAEGRHVASLDIGIFAGDRNQKQIGEVRKRVDLKLTPENYQNIRTNGVMLSSRVDTKGSARFVKAVVYQYESDLLGSAVVALR